MAAVALALMPFTKIGPDRYETPSGRVYNEKQRRLWYAMGGKFPGQKGPGELPQRQPNPYGDTSRRMFRGIMRF